jgi:cytochrome c oxidase subunit 2
MNIFAGGGVASFHIAQLSVIVFVVFMVATIVMWGLVFWLAVRRRGSFDEHASWNDPGNRVWIVLGGLAVPIAAFAWIFVLGLKTMSALPMDGAQHHERAQLRVIGHQWWWEVQYLGATPDRSFVTANEIHIPFGQPVNIELISRDVIHSFWVPRLHGKVDLVPGLDNMIQIDARQPGLYEGHCAEYCGAQHARMHLLLQADTSADFRGWFDRQLAHAASPQTADEFAGQELFMAKACGLCHTVRGTDAHGTVGPDLTHFGGRQRLASDVYPTTDDVLRTWITHAQSLKPNAQMPDINAFSDIEKRQLVAYLRRLN